MRTRVFQNSIKMSSTGVEVIYKPDGSYDRTLYFSPTPLSIEKLVMTDVVTPNFRRRMRAGELVVNPMKKEISSLTCGGGSVSARAAAGNTATYDLGSVSSTYWSMAGVSYPVLTNDGTVQSQVLSKCLSNVDAAKGSMMEDLLTVRQSVDFFTEPLSQLADATHDAQKAYRKSGLARISGLGKVAAALWLTYRFVFTPTVMSLSDLLEGLVTAVDTFKANIRLRSSSRHHHVSTSSLIKSNGPYTWKIDQELQVDVRAVVFYHFKTDVANTLQRKLGLRAKDVPAGIWAAMTLSFMVDRITNVSAALQAAANLADPNIVIEGGCYTVKERLVTRKQLQSIITSDGWTFNVSADILQTVAETVTRTPWTPSITDAVAYADPAGLTNSTTRCLDLTSLILQRIAK